MGEFAVGPRVITRNAIGQFAAECERAAGETAHDIAKEGMELARTLAPAGHKPDRRTLPIRDSFYLQRYSATQWAFANSARHALPQERGARPHIIIGSPAFQFFWEAQRRDWVPASIYYGVPGLVDVINHPGNAAQPFMGPAWDVVKQRAVAIMRRHYPGGRIG